MFFLPVFLRWSSLLVHVHSCLGACKCTTCVSLDAAIDSAVLANYSICKVLVNGILLVCLGDKFRSHSAGFVSRVCRWMHNDVQRSAEKSGVHYQTSVFKMHTSFFTVLF